LEVTTESVVFVDMSDAAQEHGSAARMEQEGIVHPFENTCHNSGGASIEALGAGDTNEFLPAD
jgi:hypothetical protein